jgi:hypothetical protein
VKQRIKHHRKDPPGHFLRNPTSHRRYPQWSPLVRFLGYVVPPQGEWDIQVPLQLKHQTLKVLLQIPLEHLNALPVHPRSTTIAFDRLECPSHLVHINAADQGPFPQLLLGYYHHNDTRSPLFLLPTTLRMRLIEKRW